MTNDNDEQQGGNRKVAKTMLYKVAKTMLFRKPQNLEPPAQPEPPAPEPTPPTAPPEEENPKVAKTLLYRKPVQPEEEKPKVAKTLLYRKPGGAPEDAHQLPLEPAEPPEQTDEPKVKVARTMLDHKMISSVRAQFDARESQRLQQEILKRQEEETIIVEPIKAQRAVRSCPFEWDEESTKEKFKYCGKCQKTLYHFDGMDIEEAEALILKRENLEKFVLYERPDGKFMTSDCPVAQKKRMQIVGLVAVVCMCVIASIAAFVMNASGPSAPTAGGNGDVIIEPAPSAVPTTEVGSDPTATTPPGVHHWKEGDPIPVRTSSTQTKPKEPQKTFSSEEQKGEFWQFPNGAPADDFSKNADGTPSN